jgi:hypothetical protein
MKKIVFGIATIIITATACNTNTSSEKNKTGDTTVVNNSTRKATDTTVITDTKVDGSMKEMVVQYLQMKNALANDNGNDAANAGKAFVVSMGKMDENSLTGDKKKKWDDLSDDAKEHGEHIGKNGDNIKHQREHFDMLSTDMYDMVKSFGAGQVLYKEFCPMANEGLGAYWLSESKQIHNPYLGKKMPNKINE